MNTVFKLFNLQIAEANDLFKIKNKKKFIFNIIKHIAILAATTIILYTMALNLALLGIKINKEILALVLLVTQVISLVFAIGNVISTLFINKNNELLLSLPASPNQIFISKFMVIYIKETIVNELLCLPVMLVCGLLGLFPLVFFFLIPLFLIILPILPISIAVFLSIPIMKILKFFKKHLLVSVIFMLLVISAAIYFYINLLSFFAINFNIATYLKETIEGINAGIVNIVSKTWLYLKLAESMLSLKFYYWILLFIGISAICITGAMLLIKPFFLRTAMESQDNVVKTSKKPKPYTKQSAFKTLLKKEIYTVFRSPGYIFQYFIFTILMPIIVVLYDKLLLILVVNQTGQLMIAGAHVLVIAVLAMLSNLISASSISREGVNFYLMKTIPVNYYTQTLAKIIFNVLFTCTSIIITGIITAFSFSPIVVIFTTISVILASIGHICQSYDYDLKKPTLDWYDNSEISTISSNITKSIISGIIIAILMGMIIILLSATKLTILPWIVLLVFSLAFCLYRIYLLVLRVYFQYDKLEI